MSLFRAGLAALAASAAFLTAEAASAESILGALAKAYQFNSQLNFSRADVRATDENVAIAKSGYRPVVTGRVSSNYSSQDRTLNAGNGTRSTNTTIGVEIDQTLFDGFQTRNNVRSQESGVFAAQEGLRDSVRQTLLSGASAYMDVIRFRRRAELRQQNLEFLNEQVRAAQSRFDVGEGTRTDVALAQADQANAVALVSQERANVAQAEANYQQVVGERPGRLDLARPIASLPSSVASAQTRAAKNHPSILRYEHEVDAAAYAVKQAEGTLLPQLTASASYQKEYQRVIQFQDATSGFNGTGFGATPAVKADQNAWIGSGSVSANLTIPLYEGGLRYAQVRQAKEVLGRARIRVDVERDQVRNDVSAAWATYTSAVTTVRASREGVAAAQLAVNGVVEERNVGQATQLDVLNAQSRLITQQLNLVDSEQQLVVQSYAIVGSIGDLSPERLGLKVAVYHPEEHYNAVKDKWIGLRTPDGR